MRNSSLSRAWRLLCCAASAGALAACAHISTAPAGMGLQQASAQYGPPSLLCQTQNGAQRAIWSQQPMAQTAWGSELDARGELLGIEQLLTDERFALLASGAWREADVRCAFGPPAKVETVGLPRARQTVWSYRYLEGRVWNSLMYVYFGQDGLVERFHPGPDPRYEPQESIRRF